MPDPRNVIAFNPLMTGTWWMSQNLEGGSGSNALESGVTYIAGGGSDPTHPYASTLGEKIIKFDGNDAAGHQFGTGAICGGGTGTGLTISPSVPGRSGTPTGAKAWAALLMSCLLYWPGTTPNADTPIAQTDQSGLNPWQLLMTTGGLAKLTVEGSTVATGTAFPSASWVQLEVWEVYKDAGGSAVMHQCVVRTMNISTRAYTNMINTTIAARPSGHGFDPQDILSIGDNTARGAGFVFYMANIARGWEDAGDPMGIRRMDYLRPNAAKGVGHLNQWTGSCANVNEMLPDDDTTKDSLSIDSTHTPRTQLYKLDDPAYVAASDFVAGGVIGMRGFFTTGAKTVVNTLSTVISDGTTDGVLGQQTGGGSYESPLRSWSFDPSGARYTNTTLKTMQAGAQATSTDPTVGGDPNKLSTIAISVLYQKNGETGTALPAAPGGLVVKQAIVQQAVNRASSY